MKIGVWLAVLALGGIFAFAVTTSTSVFSFQTAGYVVMVIAIMGLVVPRGRAWLGRRRYIRRTTRLPGGKVVETSVPPYVLRNPAAGAASTGMPSLTPDPSVTDKVKSPAMAAAEQRSRNNRERSRQEGGQGPPDSEVIEDVYEE